MIERFYRIGKLHFFFYRHGYVLHQRHSHRVYKLAWWWGARPGQPGSRVDSIQVWPRH